MRCAVTSQVESVSTLTEEYSTSTPFIASTVRTVSLLACHRLYFHNFLHTVLLLFQARSQPSDNVLPGVRLIARGPVNLFVLVTRYGRVLYAPRKYRVLTGPKDLCR